MSTRQTLGQRLQGMARTLGTNLGSRLDAGLQSARTRAGVALGAPPVPRAQVLDRPTDVAGVEPAALAAWQAAWPVVANIAPGVTLAMPLTWTSPDHENKVVRWLGYNPSHGLVYLDNTLDESSRTRLDQGLGIQPAWTAIGLDQEALVRVWQRRGINAQPLPGPDVATGGAGGAGNARAARNGGGNAAHQARQTSSVLGLRLMQANWQVFLNHLPAHVRPCLAALAALDDTRMGVELYRDSPPTQVRHTCAALVRLNTYLGAQPAPGTSAADAGLRRYQALDSAPLFARLLLDEYRADVDQGRPALPLIAGHMGCSERLVRSLIKVAPHRIGMATRFLATSVCIDMLEAMAPNVLKLLCEGGSDSTWQALGTLCHNMTGGGNHTGLLGGLHNRAWVAGGGIADPALAAAAAALGESIRARDGSLEWIGNDNTPLNRLQELASDLVTEMVAPAVVAHSQAQADLAGQTDLTTLAGQAVPPDPASPSTAIAVLSGQGLAKLQRSLKSYADGVVHGARLGQEAQGGDGMGWGEAAPAVRFPFGPTLRFLRDQNELSHEGEAMGNCVGDYGDQCEERQSVLLSMGRWRKNSNGQQAWEPSSTMQLTRSRDGSIEVCQHMARGNRTPSEMDLQAARWWMAELRAGRINLRAGSLLDENRRDAQGNLEGRVAVVLGSNWQTPDAHAHRWDRWRRLLDTRADGFGDYLHRLSPTLKTGVPAYAVLLERVQGLEAAMTPAAQTGAAQPTPAQAVQAVQGLPGQDGQDAEPATPAPGPRTA